MVHVLLGRGYIAARRGGEGWCSPTSFSRSGMQTARARDLVSTAAPDRARLFAEEVHQAAHLVVAHRGETVVIAAASGGADMNFSLKLGYRRPLADAHSGLRPDGVPAAARSRPDDRRKPGADAEPPDRRRLTPSSTGSATTGRHHPREPRHRRRDGHRLPDPCRRRAGGGLRHRRRGQPPQRAARLRRHAGPAKLACAEIAHELAGHAPSPAPADDQPATMRSRLALSTRARHRSPSR